MADVPVTEATVRRFGIARQNEFAVSLMVLIPVLFGGEAENIPAVTRSAYAAGLFCIAASGLGLYEAAAERSKQLAGAGVAALSAVFLYLISPAACDVLVSYLAVRGMWIALRRNPQPWMEFLDTKASKIGFKYLNWVTVISILGGSAIRYAAGAAASGAPWHHWIALAVFLMVTAYRFVWTTDEAVDQITKAPARGETPGY